MVVTQQVQGTMHGQQLGFGLKGVAGGKGLVFDARDRDENIAQIPAGSFRVPFRKRGRQARRSEHRCPGIRGSGRVVGHRPLAGSSGRRRSIDARAQPEPRPQGPQALEPFSGLD